MAIKVNGTVVVDDSRQLTNIASLDATTVAALGAAGVGGGGGTVDLQVGTEGGLTKGKAVGFDSVFGAANPSSLEEFSNNDTNRRYGSSSSTGQPSMKLNGDGTKIMAAMYIYGTNQHLLWCGTVNADGSITWGSKVVHHTQGGNTNSQDTVVYVGNDTWVLHYSTYNGFRNHRVRAVQWGAGNVPNYGSETTLVQGSYSDDLNHYFGCDSFQDGTFIVAYPDQSVQKVRGGTVSGTSISVGSAYTLESSSANKTPCVECNLDTGKFLISSDENTNYVAVGTQSGTSLSYTKTNITQGYRRGTWLDDTHIVCEDEVLSVNGSNQVSHVGTIDRIFNANNYTYVIDKDTQTAYLPTMVGTTTLKLIKISYDIANLKTATVVNTFEPVPSFLSTWTLGGTWQLGDYYFEDGKLYVPLGNQGHDAVVAINVNKIVSGVFGIATEDATAGSVAEVAITSGVVDGYTGLTIGASYGYDPETGDMVQGTGTFAKAFSTTSLFKT